jgi:hypothetical protein
MLKKLVTIATFATALLFSAMPATADQDVTERVLNHHLQSFGAGDIEAVMMDYTEESVIILPNGVLRGKEQIAGLFQALFAEFGKPGMTFELTNTKMHDHLAYITWKAETQDNVYNFATDTYLIFGGKITHQTVAFDVTPKN